MFNVVVILFLVIPIVGTVVRYRGSYYPKISAHPFDGSELTTVQNTGDVDVPIHNNVASSNLSANAPTDRPTFTRVLWKVWKNDQFEGLCKGFFPGLFFPILFGRFHVTPAAITLHMTEYIALPYNLVYIVFLVFTYRIIVSPRSIRLADPKSILRLVFSDYERAHPFRFLQYCGLIMPFTTQFIFDYYIYWPLRNSIPRLEAPFEYPKNGQWYEYFNHPIWSRWGWIVLYWVMPLIAMLIFTPIDVIITRLAIQPVHGQPSAEPAEDRDVEKLLDASGVAALYLQLSSQQRPYLGFVDCFQRIVKEEGWGVLYRAWWFTLLGFWVQWLR